MSVIHGIINVTVMKTNFSLFAIAVLVLLGCTKEINPNENSGKTETLTAVIEKDAFTKGYFSDSGKPRSFTWETGDKFGRVVKATNNSIDVYTATSGGEEGAFSGTPSEGATSYAIYPVAPTNGGGVTVDNTSELFFNIPSVLVYNSTHPLKDVIPMIGRREGAVYTFYPMFGAIWIPVEDMPSPATSITLSTASGQKGLSGKSVKITDWPISDEKMGNNLRTTGLKRAWMGENNTGVTYTFDSGSFTSADFYFPVPPTGGSNYTALYITIKAGDDIIAEMSMSCNISVDRAQIIKLQTISVPEVSANIAVTGTSDDIKAYVTDSSGTFNRICIAALTENSASALNTAIPDKDSGQDITNARSVGEAISVDGFTTSGEYYLGIKVFQGNTTVASHILETPVYFLSSGDKNDYMSRYVQNPNTGTTTPDKNALQQELLFNGWNTITFETSDDPLKGNIMITEFCGFSNQINNSFRSHEGYTNGNALYGKYDGANVRFIINQNTPEFYNDDTSRKHWVSPVTDSTGEKIDFRFNHEVQSVSYDLVCMEKWLGDCYTFWTGNKNNGGGITIYYNALDNNKTVSYNYAANKVVGEMIPLTSANISTLATLSSSSEGYLVDKTGGTNTWWSNYDYSANLYADSDQGIWIQIDLTDKKIVNDFTIRYLTSKDDHGIPKVIRVAASNDCTNWDYLTEEITMASSPDKKEWYQQTVHSVSEYRYIRLCIVGTYHRNVSPYTGHDVKGKRLNGYGTNGELIYATLDEIQLWGELSD